MYPRVNYLLLILAFCVSCLVLSCKEDVEGCMDPESLNFNMEANVDSGDCQYAGCTDENSVNFEARATMDDGSCMYARDAFIGAYSATETCTSNTGSSGNFSWAMTVVGAADDVTMISMSNLGDYGQTVPAIVQGNEITFDFTASSGLRIAGSGTLAGNELSLNYTVSTTSGASETCVGTATKS